VKINHCTFPEGLFYDIENFVWINIDTDKLVTVGITSVLASIAGKLSTIKLKQIGTKMEKGRSIGTIESIKYFGVVRTPVSGRLVEINESIINRPKIANDFPYTEGWFAKIECSNLPEDLKTLETIENSQKKINSLIEKLHIRCFIAFPDYQMFEIGVECAATLTKLDELVKEIAIGEVVHLVSDDPTADLEIIRWSEQKKQSLLEMRTEANLFHFIVKKIK
jgi:glycine cleavage system H lipoate-binding protein/TusA-related sulfurtransferase